MAMTCSIGIGDEGHAGHVPVVPPKIWGKIFSGNFYVKFGIFPAKIM